jgi:chromatin segregation and condensation protein Rec8/ScpA/Scc1 (kleisin family)
MDDPTQKKLLEFFEIIESPTWLIELRDIVRKQSMNIWDIDVKELAKQYMQKLETENDLNKLATGMLVCSILLKYKSKRIGLKELEGYLEEEVEKTDDEPIQETLNLEQLQQNQVSLDEFAKTLSKMIGKVDRKKYEKKKAEIIYSYNFRRFQNYWVKIVRIFLTKNRNCF